jgi:hypothetical protein
MTAQEYLEGYWLQGPHPSPEKAEGSIADGGAQGHTVPAQYNPQMYHSGWYEVEISGGASGEPRPVWPVRRG